MLSSPPTGVRATAAGRTHRSLRLRHPRLRASVKRRVLPGRTALQALVAAPHGRLVPGLSSTSQRQLPARLRMSLRGPLVNRLRPN